jgi:hypothetical protein
LSPNAIPTILSSPANSDVPLGLLGTARKQLLGFVARYHVTAIVVDTTRAMPAATVVNFFSSEYGPPLRTGPLDVWSLAAYDRATAST